MNKELKPCPFCGGKANKGHWNGNKRYDSYYIVMCTHCFARTVGETVEEAIAVWNKRSPVGQRSEDEAGT